MPRSECPTRRGEQVGEGDHLVVRARDPGAGEDRDRLRLVDRVGEGPHVGRRAGTIVGGRGRHERGGRPDRLELGDVAGKRDHGDALQRDRVPQRRVDHPRRLRGGRDQLAVVRALDEEAVRVRLLEVAEPICALGMWLAIASTGRAGAVRVVEPVDQVQVARAAAAGADGELAR